MSEELKLKPCPRCRKDVYVIHAHGCKFIRCNCGIQSSRYGEHIADWRMFTDWNCRPVEDSQAVRIAELEELAEARKLANCLLEQERNELEAERDRMRKALQVIASGHFSGRVELVNTEEMKTVWKSNVGLPMTVSEARDIARKALKGAGE